MQTRNQLWPRGENKRYAEDLLEGNSKRPRLNKSQSIVGAFFELSSKFKTLPPGVVDEQKLQEIAYVFTFIFRYADAVVTSDLDIQHLKELVDQKKIEVASLFPQYIKEEQPYVDFVETVIKSADAFIEYVDHGGLGDLKDFVNQLKSTTG